MNGVDPHLVEEPIFFADGKRQGTSRWYVPCEARAKELVADNPKLRTMRRIAWEDMPKQARDNMLRLASPQSILSGGLLGGFNGAPSPFSR